MAPLRRVSWFFGVAFSLATLTAFQQSAPAPPAGLASIRGSVRDADGAPAAGVVAVVFPADPTKWTEATSAGGPGRATVTAGRFAVGGLPAGDYRLAFTTERDLADWPSAALLERLLARKPMPVALASGEQVAVDATVRVSGNAVAVLDAMMSRTAIEMRPAGSGALPPGVGPLGRGQPSPRPASTAPGSISGRVTDADGRPAAGVEVRAMRRVGVGAASQLAGFGTSATSDADGRYRLANRSAGSYLVCVPAYAIDRTSPGGASVRGVPAPIVGPDGVKRAYQTTFHPRASNEDAAVLVAVETMERDGIDIQLARAPVFDLRGTVGGLRLAGPPTMLTVVPVRPADRNSTVEARRIPVADDGTFVIEGLRDDEYLLSVSTGTGWAQGRVVVAGRQPESVTLVIQPPVLVTGRAEFRGAAPLPVNPANPMQSGIELAPAVLTSGASFTRVPIQPDGSFTARGMGPGPFILRAFVPAPWIQVAGLINGRDTLDIPWSPGQTTEGALVIFADRASSLMIRVRNAQDESVADAGVVVFSEDPTYWSGRSRRVQLAQTSAAGICTLTDFPPGRYHIVASRDFGSNRTVTRAFVESLPRGFAFELAAGEIRSILVRVN